MENPGAAKRFGRELASVRKSAGITQGKLGRACEASDSHISNLEQGKREPSPLLLPKLDDALGTGDGLTRLWDELTGSGRPVWLDEVNVLLRDAVSVLDYQLAVFPALIQTEGYARELIASGLPWVSASDVEALVTSRMERARTFVDAPAPLLWVVLDSSVVSRRFVSDDVRREQLAHVVALADQGRVSVQLVDSDYQGHPGLTGAFKVISPETGPDVVYADSIHEGQVITAGRHVAHYRLLFGRLQAVARGPVESVSAIRGECES